MKFVLGGQELSESDWEELLVEADRRLGRVGDRIDNLILILRSGVAKDVILDARAHEHLWFGLGRRLLILRRSITFVRQSVPPDRMQPLTDDERHDLNLHLNSLYVHVRGATDNLAWALHLEHDVCRNARPNQVGLLVTSFRNALKTASPELDNAISPHCEALSKLSELRDPVAHRIPLYVIPAFLSEGEARRYDDLGDEWNKALTRRDLDAGASILDAQSKLGRFLPFFGHSQREEFPLLHQRLAADLEALVGVISATLDFLKRNKRDPAKAQG